VKEQMLRHKNIEDHKIASGIFTSAILNIMIHNLRHNSSLLGHSIDSISPIDINEKCFTKSTVIG
jgi:hypothetical protein